MQAKTVSPETEALQRRFFEALNELIRTEKIKGLKAFLTKYNLHEAKYVDLRSHALKGEEARYKVIDPDALVYIVRDYGVSADWLLAGRGEMFPTETFEQAVKGAVNELLQRRMERVMKQPS